MNLRQNLAVAMNVEAEKTSVKVFQLEGDYQIDTCNHP